MARFPLPKNGVIRLPSRPSAPIQEKSIQDEIRQALAKLPHVVCWRNNTGLLKDARGIPVRFGLCVGSSDLIGICRGRFFALEVKRPGGKVTPDQERFLSVVTKFGGIAAVVRSVEEALCALDT